MTMAAAWALLLCALLCLAELSQGYALSGFSAIDLALASLSRQGRFPIPSPSSSAAASAGPSMSFSTFPCSSISSISSPPSLLSYSVPPQIFCRVSRRGSTLRGQDFSLTRINFARLTDANVYRKTHRDYPCGHGFPDPMCVYVGNLPPAATEQDVIKWLEDEGAYMYPVHVTSVKIMRKEGGQESARYGFARFDDPIWATGAIEMLNGKELGGKKLELKQGVKKFDLDALTKMKAERKERKRKERIERRPWALVPYTLPHTDRLGRVDTGLKFDWRRGLTRGLGSDEKRAEAARTAGDNMVWSKGFGKGFGVGGAEGGLGVTGDRPVKAKKPTGKPEAAINEEE